MPIFEYQCSCGQTFDFFSKAFEPPKYKFCTCGKRARRLISLPNTDLKNNERYSSAMGVNIRQIEQTKKLYPGSEYDKKGRLLIKNRKHKLYEMKRRGKIELD